MNLPFCGWSKVPAGETLSMSNSSARFFRLERRGTAACAEPERPRRGVEGEEQGAARAACPGWRFVILEGSDEPERRQEIRACARRRVQAGVVISCRMPGATTERVRRFPQRPFTRS